MPQPCAAAHNLLTFTKAQATAGPHSSWQASPLLRDQTNESSAAAKTPAYHQHPGTDARGNQPPLTSHKDSGRPGEHIGARST